MPCPGFSVWLRGFERNYRLIVVLKMGNVSPPLMAYRLMQKLQLASPPERTHCGFTE